MIEYFYTDQVELTAELACDVMRISNQYRLPHLKAITEKFLSKHISLENIITLLMLSDEHEAVELKRICLDFA